MTLYSVFVLIHPSQPDEVKFVGMTSQSVAKRVTDMLNGATKDYTKVARSPIGKWLRDVHAHGVTHISRTVGEYQDRDIAVAAFKDLFNESLKTSLNGQTGAAGGLRKEVLTKEVGGRPVSDTPNSAKQLKRKSVRK